MKLALGILFLWLGASLLWLATHSTQATRPWEAYQQIIGAIRAGVT